MKNWETLQADVNAIMNKHFTHGRQGNKITGVVIHHNSGNLTTEGCYEVWQTRSASAHYQVEESGRIGQLVWDGDTAWHAGDWKANLTCIGIEHANDAFAPSWTVSEATLENGAHLVAAICRRYGLGRPVWGVNVFPHNRFKSTDCPGALGGGQNAAYMSRAQYWFDQMATGADVPAAATPTTSPSGDVMELARAVLRGDYGDGARRRSLLGARYSEVQSLVNQILAGNANPTQDIEALARAVIRGEYGNGEERKARLGRLYEQVQARVNQLV